MKKKIIIFGTCIVALLIIANTSVSATNQNKIENDDNQVGLSILRVCTTLGPDGGLLPVPCLIKINGIPRGYTCFFNFFVWRGIVDRGNIQVTAKILRTGEEKTVSVNVDSFTELVAIQF